MIDLKDIFTCIVLGTLIRGTHLVGLNEPSGNLEMDSSKILHFKKLFLVLKKVEPRRKKQVMFSWSLRADQEHLSLSQC